MSITSDDAANVGRMAFRGLRVSNIQHCSKRPNNTTSCNTGATHLQSLNEEEHERWTSSRRTINITKPSLRYRDTCGPQNPLLLPIGQLLSEDAAICMRSTLQQRTRRTTKLTCRA